MDALLPDVYTMSGARTHASLSVSARCMAPSMAMLAPWPWKGLIGCAESPTRTTRLPSLSRGLTYPNPQAAQSDA
jgi:hypothetical protein